MKIKLKKTFGVCAMACFSSVVLLADPGELYAKRKAAIVSKYDVNDDGRLDMKERLSMRASVIKENQKNKGGGPGMMPPELIEAFDKNKDGKVDDAEQQVMNAEMGKKFGEMLGKYDENSDGELKGEELLGLKEDSEKGTLKGLDAFVSRFLIMRFSRGGTEGEKDDWSRFDVDGDGVASVKELEAIRDAKLHNSLK